jgi:hypothetical protein
LVQAIIQPAGDCGAIFTAVADEHSRHKRGAYPLTSSL